MSENRIDRFAVYEQPDPDSIPKRNPNAVPPKLDIVLNDDNRRFFERGRSEKRAYLKLSAIEALEKLLNMPATDVLSAVLAIKNRALYDVEAKEFAYVNKLLYLRDELFIKGFNEASQYRVSERSFSWIEKQPDREFFTKDLKKDRPKPYLGGPKP